MGKIILKTVKRETTVSRQAVRDAVSAVYYENFSPKKGSSSSSNKGSTKTNRKVQD